MFRALGFTSSWICNCRPLYIIKEERPLGVLFTRRSDNIDGYEAGHLLIHPLARLLGARPASALQRTHQSDERQSGPSTRAEPRAAADDS